MNNEDLIRNALNTLTGDKVFHAVRMDYNEKNFGNTCIELTSNERVSIRFIKDKGAFWCEIGQDNQWYFVEDVLDFIGDSMESKSSEFVGYIDEVAKLIKVNKIKMFELFNSENSKDMLNKLKEVATKRAMMMFELTSEENASIPARSSTSAARPQSSSNSTTQN